MKGMYGKKGGGKKGSAKIDSTFEKAVFKGKGK